MSAIGGTPIDTSLLQTAQAQQVASKARDKEKAASERARRFADLVELRVAGMETAEAIRKLPHNDSQQAYSEHRAQQETVHIGEDEDGRQHIDVTA